MRIVTQPASPCWLFHNWWTTYTCATYHQTGPLPGESHTFNAINQKWYRYERVCMDCGVREYNAHGRWWRIPLPIAKKDPT